MQWLTITKNTLLEEVKRIHQDIWQYVVDNGEKPITPYVSNCALCEYVRIHDFSCIACPVKWHDSFTCYNPYHINEYVQWMLDPSAANAKRIRDILFKYELEEKNGGSEN